MRLSGTKTAAIHQYRGLGKQLYDLAGNRPSLDLDFAGSKSLVDQVSGQNLVTFTRASDGTYVDSTGTLRTATTNEARFDHNPTTGESLGLLVEEQRTNSIRNNTMVGAVAGTPGTLPTNWATYGSGGVTGITTSVVSVGTEGGVSYIDIRFNGTPSISAVWSLINEITPGFPAAATGQTWTYSAWVRMIAGSAANITFPVIFFDENNSGAFVTGGTIATSFLVSTVARYSATRTLSGGATVNLVNGGIRFSVTAGAAIDITLRIGLPQLEQGAFATSVIPTTTAAATRSADVASITGSAFSSWYRQDVQTWFGEYVPVYNASATVPANIPHLMQVYNTAVNTNNYAIRGAGNSMNQEFVARNPTAGAQFINNPGIGFGIAGTNRKVSFGIDSSTLNNSTNGTIGSVSNNAAALMATHDILSIGSGTGGSPPYQLNGTIRRLTYWPARLPNSTLQAITQ
jgi:hypothetical protein